jgi:hypothetical protein
LEMVWFRTNHKADRFGQPVLITSFSAVTAGLFL